MDLQQSMGDLYNRIVNEKPSQPNEDTFQYVTTALNRILWATTQLERVERSLQSALSTLEDAASHIDTSLREVYFPINYKGKMILMR